MEIDDGTSTEPAINVTVKFSGRSMPLLLSPDSTVKDLKSLLQPLTDVLPRGQKLISKGKVLVDTMTLKQSEVKNGAKIMLMASQGLHQGDGPVLKQAVSRPNLRTRNAEDKKSDSNKLNKASLTRWQVTGVVGLSDSNLKDIPGELWDLGPSVRVMDISNNSIQILPSKIECFSSLHKLLLNGNGLSDESIEWEGVASLNHLTFLSLSQNLLTKLPSAVRSLTSLKVLEVANNKLTSLPSEINFLTQLEILKANNNRISRIPTSIGDCDSLSEVDLSSNLLSELPESFSYLKNLKALHLSNNGMKTLPSALFKKCLQLSTLDLHNTEITIDILRQLDGWEEFDERRRLKHQKQLDFRVVSSGKFDEGADKS